MIDISEEDLRRLIDHLQDTANPHLYQDPILTPGTISTTGQMNESVRTEVIDTTGLTRTLPKAANNLIGKEWTVLLAIAGIVTIAPDTGDSITLPTADTSISIISKGDSLTFRCLTSTTWGLV